MDTRFCFRILLSLAPRASRFRPMTVLSYRWLWSAVVRTWRWTMRCGLWPRMWRRFGSGLRPGMRCRLGSRRRTWTISVVRRRRYTAARCGKSHTRQATCKCTEKSTSFHDRILPEGLVNMQQLQALNPACLQCTASTTAKQCRPGPLQPSRCLTL